MALQILVERPPIWDDAAKVFDLEANKPIFAWGVDKIYNPYGHDLSKEPWLIAHEDMHGQRQGKTDAAIKLWWTDYIDSATFRLEEEIPAHRAEYRQMLRSYENNRANRRRFLKQVAQRLRNPLYKYSHLFSMEQAKAWIALDEHEYRD